METQEVRYLFMPYCIQRLQDGRHIILNRNYKPLGTLNREFVDYDAHPSAAKIKITKASARKISYEASDAIDRIYLYNDGCVPTSGAAEMKAYLARLGALAKLKVEIKK